MPPKNKGSAKKPAKIQTPTMIDGLTKDELSKEQLKEHIVRLREELDRVREEKNYFQLERDKMQTFKDVTDRNLEVTKATLKKLNKDIEDDEIHHKVELEVYKQKMKHLLCEHQNTICELEADAVTSTEVMKKEQENIEAELHQEMKTLALDMEELDTEVLFKQLNDEEFAKKKEFLLGKFKDSKWLEDSRHLLTNQQKNILIEEEDRWYIHFSDLVDNMSKALADTEAATGYFQQATDDNAALQKKLQDGTEELKKKERALASIMQDNKRLAQLVKEAEDKKDNIQYRLKQQAKLYATDRSLKKQIIAQKAENEALEQEFGKLQLERDELRDTIAQSHTQMQHEADVRIAEREEKLKALMECLEQTDAQLHAVLSASNIDQTALAELMRECKEKIDSYNWIIKDLKEKKACVATAGESLLLRSWQAKKL